MCNFKDEITLLKDLFLSQDVVQSSELNGIFKMWGKHMLGYIVDESNKKCLNYAIGELSFIEYLRNKVSKPRTIGRGT